MQYNDMESNQASNKQAYLREVDIFCDLAPDELASLGQHAPMKRVTSGTVFYSPEQASEVLFILKEGRVRLYHLSAEGKMLTTAILDAGTIFGEMALLGQGLHGSYAEAVTPCVLCLMSREDVKQLLLSDQRIALRITEMLGKRLIEAERRLSDFAFKQLPQRVATLLVQLAQTAKRPWFARGGKPELHYTHEDLANMVGTHRESVTKVLNDFQNQGFLELHRGKIVLLDLTKLHEMSST